MLTTTVDGLWVLQVLTGIEVLAPELGLRPHLPSVESPDLAMHHPVFGDLVEAGAVDEHGNVDAVVREWLTVLTRRDLALLFCTHAAGRNTDCGRAILARFAQWWVVLERRADVVSLSASGAAATEDAAVHLIAHEVGRLVGQGVPAPIRPATLDADDLVSKVSDRDSLRDCLIGQRIDPDQIAALLDACTPGRSSQVSIVAVRPGPGGGLEQIPADSEVVTVVDAVGGRLVVEHLRRDGKAWMVVSPGSLSAVGAAVQKMLRRLPAQGSWHSYRKAV